MSNQYELGLDIKEENLHEMEDFRGDYDFLANSAGGPNPRWFPEEVLPSARLSDEESELTNQLNSNADGTFKVIIKNEGQAAGGKTNTLEVRKPSSPLTGMWQECESVCCSSKSKIHKRQRARRDRETSAGAVIKCIPDKAQSSDLLLKSVGHVVIAKGETNEKQMRNSVSDEGIDNKKILGERAERLKRRREADRLYSRRPEVRARRRELGRCRRESRRAEATGEKCNRSGEQKQRKERKRSDGDNLGKGEKRRCYRTPEERKQFEYIQRLSYKARLTEEERKRMNRHTAIQAAIRRGKETPEEREARLQRMHDRYVFKRATMTPEEHEEFNAKQRERLKKAKDAGGGACQKYSDWSEAKKEKQRAYLRELMKRETPEQRARRLAKLKRNQEKRVTIKKYQEGGLTKEEATEKLRIARPDLFPPPAPRRRGGLAGSYRHRCSQTRPKGAGRPTNVTEEELQTYIATRQTRNRDKMPETPSFVPEGDNTCVAQVDAVETNTEISLLTTYAEAESETIIEELAQARFPLDNSSNTSNQGEKETLSCETMREPTSNSLVEQQMPSVETSVVPTRTSTRLVATSAKQRMSNFIKLIVKSDFEGHEWSDSIENPPPPPIPVNYPDDDFDYDEFGNLLSTEDFEMTNDVENLVASRREYQWQKHVSNNISDNLKLFNPHMEFSHAPEDSRTFVCPVIDCKRGFTVAEYLYKHYKMIHILQKVQEQNTLFEHTMTARRKRLALKLDQFGDAAFALICPQCGKKFAFPHAVSKHIYEVHQGGVEKFLCEYCEKSFKQKCTLQDHVRRTHFGLDHKCDICDRSFQSATKLYNHKVHAHDMKDLNPRSIPNLKIMSCQYCNAEMFRGMKAHIEKEHPERLNEYALRMKHKCDMCEKSCQSATLLYNHKVQIHRRHDLDPTSIPNVKLLACEFCQMKVAMNMREHVKQAHPERLGEYVEGRRARSAFESGDTFFCRICQKIFSRKRNQRMHNQLNHPELLIGDREDNRLSCVGCDKKFWTAPDLGIHILGLHKEVFLQVDFDVFNGTCCHFCAAELGDSYVLRVHLIHDHNTEVLELFKKLLSQPAVTQVTTQGSKAQCKYCWVNFTRNTSARQHMKLKHPDKPSEDFIHIIKLRTKTKLQTKTRAVPSPKKTNRKYDKILNKFPEIKKRTVVIKLERIDSLKN